MKKLFAALMALVLVGCSSGTTTPTETPATDGVIAIEDLELQFVPSKDADVIITGTQNLPELLQAALLEEGYDVGTINITVGSSYDATGEAMDAGTVDIGWVPGGTYALYSDGIDVLLTATRAGLSNDSTDAATWNGEANKTLNTDEEVTYYRSLIYAAPTAKGQELAAKIANGEELTWEDLNSATWAVQKTSSSAGYIYPTLWLLENYDKKITDLSNVVTLDSGYGTAFAQAAAEQVDIIVCYADGRLDYEEAWTLPVTETDSTGKTGFGREGSIWDELSVIGVTEGIYNDAVAISRADETLYNADFIEAIQNAMINVIGTEEGQAIFSVYSHTGYAKAVDADYDGARAALEAAK
ncbi:MAG: phosphate/phosphite/phosphonate ABC transporter substrate-binding protein [Anaerorhabdus sp.]